MTLEEIMQQIHDLVEGNVDYPDETEDTYLSRLNKIKRAVKIWEDEEGVLWNELFVSLADATDGDKTATSGTGEYAAPSDFKFPLGYLELNGSYYKLIKPQDIQLYEDSSTKVWYVTGNDKVGKTIHIYPVPGDDEDGKTINYYYYKTPFVPTQPSDVFEMSDPMFVAYWVASEEIKEENPGLSDYYMQIALNKLNQMKLKNDIPSWLEEVGLKDANVGFGI